MKKKTSKRIVSESMSTSFLMIVVGRLQKVLLREMDAMIKEIEDVRNDRKIIQRKRK